MSRTPQSYEREIALNKRPHPSRPRKTVELRCLGHACGGKKFMSAGRAINRLCPSCARNSDAVVGGNVGHRLPAKGRSS